MIKFLGRHGLIAGLLIGFACAMAVAAGTNLGTVGHYQSTVVAKTAAYTVSCPTDSGTELSVTVSITVAITLPNNGTVGCQIGVTQSGTAKVTFVAQTGGSLLSPHSFTGTFAQGSLITARVIANSGGSAAQWNFAGDGS
jgi:hypothetical protein